MIFFSWLIGEEWAECPAEDQGSKCYSITVLIALADGRGRRLRFVTNGMIVPWRTDWLSGIKPVEMESSMALPNVHPFDKNSHCCSTVSLLSLLFLPATLLADTVTDGDATLPRGNCAAPRPFTDLRHC
ncbi:hypothetical protein QQ73_09415, partial [Candidatus Endoriftia persephone str. Guaymas]|nr:hypothetical protein [Candidatus Endoriftia persephone str. Guaymas]